MNGFAFCETETKRQCRQHRLRLPDLTKCLITSNIGAKCESRQSQQPDKQMCCPPESIASSPATGGLSLCSIVSDKGLQVCQTVLILCVCCVCYANALSCDFSFDDISAIKQNQDLRPETPLSQLVINDFWGQPMVKVCADNNCYHSS